jgi:hypothetical protein
MARRPRANPATRRRLRAEAATATRTKKLGSGERFKAVAASAKAGGARDPEAVAAAIGRKKFGAKKMVRLAAKGKK